MKQIEEREFWDSAVEFGLSRWFWWVTGVLILCLSVFLMLIVREIFKELDMLKNREEEINWFGDDTKRLTSVTDDVFYFPFVSVLQKVFFLNWAANCWQFFSLLLRVKDFRMSDKKCESEQSKNYMNNYIRREKHLKERRENMSEQMKNRKDLNGDICESNKDKIRLKTSSIKSVDLSTTTKTKVKLKTGCEKITPMIKEIRKCEQNLQNVKTFHETPTDKKLETFFPTREKSPKRYIKWFLKGKKAVPFWSNNPSTDNLSIPHRRVLMLRREK